MQYLWITFILLALIYCLTGCAGTGFDKQCTLTPDEVSLSVGEDEMMGRGISITATWYLNEQE